jgi:hypothetical protein
MIRNKLSLLVICAALATQGQVLCRWTADSSRTTPVEFSCFRGESLLLSPTLASYGTSITNYTATLLWQTNGMGTAWWSTNVLAFTPSMDVGATRYTIFIRAAMTNGVNYRANGTITMRNAPGFTPNTLPLPVPSIDFATVNTTNAPWLLSELDPGIPAAITSAVAQAGTNATATVTVHNTNGTAHADIRGAFLNYLPLAGGIMQGPIRFQTAYFDLYFGYYGIYKYSPLDGSDSYYTIPDGEVGSYTIASREWTTTQLTSKAPSTHTNDAAAHASLFNAKAPNTHTNDPSAHASLFNAKADASRTITVNGTTGTLSSNLSFTVTGLSSNDATAIANAAVHGALFTNQTWSASGTNATYRMSWDVTNGTFKVEEILP